MVIVSLSSIVVIQESIILLMNWYNHQLIFVYKKNYFGKNLRIKSKTPTILRILLIKDVSYGLLQ